MECLLAAYWIAAVLFRVRLLGSYCPLAFGGGAILCQGCASSQVLGRAGLGGWLGLKCYLAWGGEVGGGEGGGGEVVFLAKHESDQIFP